jgi:hypothetical protein
VREGIGFTIDDLRLTIDDWRIENEEKRAVLGKRKKSEPKEPGVLINHF